MKHFTYVNPNLPITLEVFWPERKEDSGYYYFIPTGYEGKQSQFDIGFCSEYFDQVGVSKFLDNVYSIKDAQAELSWKKSLIAVLPLCKKKD